MDFDKIAQDAAAVVTALEPLIVAAVPEAAAAVAIGAKIVQGAIALEPAALALYNQIKAGTPPTTAQIQNFETDYEAAYRQLRSDIAAQLGAAG
ncbi:MAG: hypothetical protein HY243_17800 [Proteobacteria bacterium]|nr:hypothetical protein [Pseudomonadota bacterium]